MKTNIIDLEAVRLAWSLETFPEATAESSLNKLREEIKEVERLLSESDYTNTDLSEEYADCLMCLFDSAGRAGIRPAEIFEAFKYKLKKNQTRVWKKNPDNTYSHVKPVTPQIDK